MKQRSAVGSAASHLFAAEERKDRAVQPSKQQRRGQVSRRTVAWVDDDCNFGARVRLGELQRLPLLQSPSPASKLSTVAWEGSGLDMRVT